MGYNISKKYMGRVCKTPLKMVDITGYLQQYIYLNLVGSKGYISCRRKPSKEDIAEHEILYKELKKVE